MSENLVVPRRLGKQDRRLLEDARTNGKVHRMVVTRTDFLSHKRAGKNMSMRANYNSLLSSVSEWISFEGQEFARDKAAEWWIQAGGSDPVPKTTLEALNRTDEITKVAAVRFFKAGEWPRIVAVEYDTQEEDATQAQMLG